MESSKSFSRQLALDISQSSLVDEFKKAVLQLRLHQLEARPLTLLFAGPQGVGKTATIRALFGESLFPSAELDAVSGITRYQSGDLIVWDYPGLTGDKVHDQLIEMQIGATLSEHDGDGNPLIDMAVVVLDAAERNLNDGYRLITDIIVPALGSEFEDRLVVALNKVDVASYAYDWDFVMDSPSPEVEIWPESTASLLRHCLLDESGLEIAPVCIAAELTRQGESTHPFNLMKLMATMLEKLPAEKKFVLMDAPLNPQSLAWLDGDDRKDYLTVVENTLFDTVYEGAKGGSRFGGLLGAYLGKQGREVGYLLRRNLRQRFNLA
ncbi:hypothetical protein LRP49_20750 [Enterovibrio sp. ZSDZ35]|uniref:G domain-containing protein n=1 Tax=Enterovibrio qingdaonensis TaxID=2899818 RepID=A0ABT5QRK0_9GAMM|nr:hypothetical protein [Enterovibrio sp. ZSDZ35]MDD1783608.1 hypothetical protein [Enterovibrio sp. ZSDZ35]